MSNIEQRVKKIVSEQLGVNESEVKNESSFVNDLGADSLDTVELFRNDFFDALFDIRHVTPPTLVKVQKASAFYQICPKFPTAALGHL